jgi:hypothetical protein
MSYANTRLYTIIHVFHPLAGAFVTIVVVFTQRVALEGRQEV